MTKPIQLKLGFEPKERLAKFRKRNPFLKRLALSTYEKELLGYSLNFTDESIPSIKRFQSKQKSGLTHGLFFIQRPFSARKALMDVKE